jgi:tetratricopeptide (TPR) repeat protein
VARVWIGPAALLAIALSAACVARAPRSRQPGPEARVVSSGPARVFGDDLCGPGSLAVLLNSLGDPATPQDLDAALPKAPGGGVLSVDLLLAARQRGFVASLAAGDPASVRTEVLEGRAAVLMLRLFDAPGRRRDVYHYVVVDGFDPRQGLYRVQYGDGQFRWAALAELEGAWKAAGHALLRIRPGDRGAQIQRALDLETEGRREEARALYKRILVADPASVRAWTNLGNVEVSAGRPADAEQAYRAALAVAPADRDALNNLAWLLYEQGLRLEEAEALARRAVGESGPDPAPALDTLGRIQLAQGRCKDAERTFGEALALDSPARPGLRASLLLGRGDSEKACGLIAEARASFEEALESEPDERTVRAARSALEALPSDP